MDKQKYIGIKGGIDSELEKIIYFKRYSFLHVQRVYLPVYPRRSCISNIVYCGILFLSTKPTNLQLFPARVDF